MSRFTELTRDPLRVNAFLIVFAFGSVFILPSQTTSSVITYLLAVLMLVRASRWRSYLSDPVLALSGCLLGYLTLSALWSDPFEADEIGSLLSRSLSTFLFLVAFAESWQTGLIERWFNRTVAVCGGLGAYAAIVYFFVTAPDDGRLNGLGQLGAHVIAGLLFGVVLLHLLESLRQDPRLGWRLIAAVMVLGLVTALLLTGSRNAWVSVLAGLVVYGCASISRSRRLFLLLAGTAALLAILILALMYFDESWRALLLPRGDSFRTLIWSTILERVWTEGPIFGLGILTPDDVINGAVVHPHPHSMYLAVLYQGGAVALVGLLLLTGLVLVRLYGALERPEARVALGVLTIGLLSYLLDGHELVDRIGETWLLFWLPVAVALTVRVAPAAARASPTEP